MNRGALLRMVHRMNGLSKLTVRSLAGRPPAGFCASTGLVNATFLLSSFAMCVMENTR